MIDKLSFNGGRRLLMVVGFVFFVWGEVGEAAANCACPKVQCDACQMSDGLTFYAKKCGGSMNQTKSCSKPKCFDKDPLPKKCVQARMAAKKAKAQAMLDKNKKPEMVKHHEPIKKVHPNVGIVKVVKGKAWVGSGKTKKIVKKGMKIKEKDMITTNKGGAVRMDFNDGNSLHVTAGTQVLIDKVDTKKSERKTLIELLKGRIRNKIRNKYKGTKKSYYQVKTRSAVAGVRGTDFVVDFTEGQQLETRIQTLEGNVELAVLGSEAQAIEIPKGMYASYVVDASSSVFNEDEISDFVASGYMTPVYKLSEKEIAKIDTDTDIKEAASHRAVASNDAKESLCEAPVGNYNQCSWSCSAGKSSGDNGCEEGYCVRHRCNANGKWADPTHLPSARCTNQSSKVSSCDY